MGPLDLAMAGSSIFAGVGGAIDSGKQAGKEQDTSAMRSKEVVGSLLVGTTGLVLAIREKAVWPLLVAGGVILLIVCLHEYHANKAAPYPDLSYEMVGNLK